MTLAPTFACDQRAGVQARTRPRRPMTGTPLRSRPYPRQRFENPRVLRLQPTVHCHALCGILAQEDQSVPYVVRLIDRLGQLLHHLALGIRADTLRCLDEQNWHVKLPTAAYHATARLLDRYAHKWHVVQERGIKQVQTLGALDARDRAANLRGLFFEVQLERR